MTTHGGNTVTSVPPKGSGAGTAQSLDLVDLHKT